MARNRKSLKYIAQQVLEEKLRIGESKHQAKRDGSYKNYIYSFSTFSNYLKHSRYFLDYCRKESEKEGKRLRTLEDCKPYVEKYIKYEIDRNLSPYTIKLKLASLNKLYSCEFDIKTPSRYRKDIKRSRYAVDMDRHFSEKSNKDLICFAKATGLRRMEIAAVRKEDITFVDGNAYVHVRRGKGGRVRTNPIITSTQEEWEAILNLYNNSSGGKLFRKISGSADIHHFRAIYCRRVYEQNFHPNFRNERIVMIKNKIIGTYETTNGRKSISKLKSLCKTNGISIDTPNLKDLSGAYYCRKDRKGEAFSRYALAKCSEALGHGSFNRVNVVAEHYLYT